MTKQVIFKGIKKGFLLSVFYDNPYSEDDIDRVHRLEGLTKDRAEEYIILIDTLIEKMKFFGKSFSRYHNEMTEVLNYLHDNGKVSTEFFNMFDNLGDKNIEFVDQIFGKFVRSFNFDEKDPYPKDLVSHVYGLSLNYFENDIAPIIAG